MTGDRLQIRTKQHGQAPALTTAALPQPVIAWLLASAGRRGIAARGVR
jgi:hypothetical protein